MLSKFLMVPFAIISIVCLYFAWESQLSPMYVVPGVIIIAILWVTSPQIDWWWANRYPPQVDPKAEAFLRKFFPYYARLSLPAKKRFLQRIALYEMATEFMPMVMDEVPQDIKVLIAANIVMLTFGQEDYRLSRFEKIVVYPHPFPSPQYPEHIHSTEHYEEDGVLLFSLEQLVPGATQSNRYYNIVLHEYAKIYALINRDKNYPKFDQKIWEQLTRISGFKTEGVKNYIGLPILEPLPISITYFFTFPVQFKQVLPELYLSLQRIFNQDPARGDFPVIDPAQQGPKI